MLLKYHSKKKYFTITAGVLSISAVFWGINNALKHGVTPQNTRTLASTDQPPFTYRESEPRTYCGVPHLNVSCETAWGRTTVRNIWRSPREIIEFWRLSRPSGWYTEERDAEFSTGNNAAESHMNRHVQMLKSYWESIYNRVVFTEDTLNTFKFDSPLNEIQINDLLLNRIENLNTILGRNTHSIMRRALTNAAFEEAQLIDHIAHWWAMRSLLLKSACADDHNGILRSARKSRPFIELQYAYQDCRRQYMRTAVARLNRSAQERSLVSMDGTEWIIINSLGSRHERAWLFIEASPHLEQQISQGQYPTERELYFIANTILQTFIELNHKKVLTWNGLQDMDHADVPGQSIDESLLRLQLNRASKLFLFLADSALNIRSSNPQYYRLVDDIWNSVSRAIPVDLWTTEASSAENNQQISRDLSVRANLQRLSHMVRCQEGNEVSCIIWMQRAYEYLKHSTTINHAAAEWSRLICGLTEDHIQPNYLLKSHIRPRVFLQLVNGFKYMKQQMSANRRNLSIWQRAQRNIERCLIRDVTEHWRVPMPSALDLMMCVDDTLWEKIIQKPTIEQKSEIIRNMNCNYNNKEYLFHWILELARLSAVASGYGWYDTGIAKIRRYYIWHQNLNPNRTPVAPLSVNESTVIFNNLQSYYYDDNSVSAFDILYYNVPVSRRYLRWSQHFRDGMTPDWLFRKFVAVPYQMQESSNYD